MVRRLAIVAGGFALLVGCEAEFYGDLGEIGFATNLTGWTPARAVARGAVARIGVAEVGGRDEGWKALEGRVTGDLTGTELDEDGILEVDGDRGRVHFVAAGPDGVPVDDHFPIRFEDPQEARVNGESRLGIVAGDPCPVDLSLHGRRGAPLGHDPDAIGVAGDEGLEVWTTGGASIEVAAAPGAGRLEITYGDFGAVVGPEIVGVTLDEIVRVEPIAIRLPGNDPHVVLVPMGYLADDTPVACVPVVWDIPAGMVVEQGDPGESGYVPAVVVAGKGVPEGLGAHVLRP